MKMSLRRWFDETEPRTAGTQRIETHCTFISEVLHPLGSDAM
jgi:hypothetical protein